MLRQASTTYTPPIFKMFQEQVLRTLNYDTFLCDDSDTEEKVYKVKFHGTERDHVVKFFPKEEKVNCSCKKFEFAGILCSHSLKVLDINNIKHIPQQYILKRWTIDAKVLDITSNCNLHEDRKTILTKRYKELCRMFIQIAARAAESEESYLMAANYAEKLAEEVEKCLKHRSDPDTVGDSNNITTTSSKQNERPTKPKGMKVKEKTARGSNRHPDIFADPNINPSTSSEQNEGFANPTEPNINSCTSSKQNKGLAKPKGIKLKEKTIQGASRPIGGLEKAKSKRKRKVDNPVALQPHGTSMGHSKVFTNQMPAYLPQYNPILNPMAMYGQDQRLPAELQHYNSLMDHLGVPTNHVYTYSEQCNSALDASLLPSLGTMRGHPAPNFSLQPTIGTMRGHPALNASLQSSIGTMNQAPNASLQPSVGTMTGHPTPNASLQHPIGMMIRHPALNAPLQPSVGTMTCQNQVFFQQQKPT
ncbi:uncharacterized protein [Triticum aestivum]|uniref:uncharacterized protein n=1 Tax=Triticum aestivum TaxID=4565 RepID=UPI001D00C388|nr:uncharacterized protein LOC123059707 [Triticum aestivum]